MFAGAGNTVIGIYTAGLYLLSFNYATSATATITAANGYIAIDGANSASTWPRVDTTLAYGNVNVVASLTVGQAVSANVIFVGGSAYIIQGAATATAVQTRLSATWIGRTS